MSIFDQPFENDEFDATFRTYPDFRNSGVLRMLTH